MQRILTIAELLPESKWGNSSKYMSNVAKWRHSKTISRTSEDAEKRACKNMLKSLRMLVEWVTQ